MKQITVLALAVVFVTGCSALTADQIDALGKDPATVCLQINTVYGTAHFARTAIVNGNVKCDSDGLTVRSDGATIGVPIVVTPQIRVEPAVPAPRR